MTSTDNPEQISWVKAAQAYGVSLTAEQISQFARYETLLLEWNTRFNLTAITDPEEVRIRHFLDSLSCALVLNKRVRPEQKLIDIGTGAGFPGLPLKIIFPQLSVTLADSVAKKVGFLDAVIAELGLSSIATVSERAENLGRDRVHREQYDWVVARSVAEMKVLSEYLLPLCRVGGVVLAQKGEAAPTETAGAAAVVTLLGGKTTELIPVNLPGHDLAHYLIVIEKEKETPPKYPRRPGMPAKRPLG